MTPNIRLTDSYIPNFDQEEEGETFTAFEALSYSICIYFSQPLNTQTYIGSCFQSPTPSECLTNIRLMLNTDISPLQEEFLRIVVETYYAERPSEN